MASRSSVVDFESRTFLPTRDLNGGRTQAYADEAQSNLCKFSANELPDKVLSGLLWAADRINRKALNDGTVQIQQSSHRIDIYLARASGLSLYQPGGHFLEHVSSRDVRDAAGLQDVSGTAPVNLIYVSDLARVDIHDPHERRFYCGADVGAIARDVSLFCEAESLSCVVHGVLNRRELRLAMQLASRQRILLAQSIGLPGWCGPVGQGPT